MMRNMTFVALALACGAASAGGSVQAVQSNVAYYTTTFDGADARFALFECKAPVFPAASQSQDGVRRVERSVRQWRTCFARWQDKMVAVLPAGKAIPDDVSKAMSAADLAKARETMESAYRAIIEEALAQDEKVNKGILTWMKGTAAIGGRDAEGFYRVRFGQPADHTMMTRRWREGLPGGPL